MSRAARHAQNLRWDSAELITHILANIEEVERGELSTPCWEWQGSRTKDGYGQFSANAAFRGSGQRLVHRASYAAHNEFTFTSRAQQVMHQCHNRSCCNPDHLKLGTAKENMQQAIERGSFADSTGERNRNSKLSEADIRSIRQLWKSGLAQPAIALRFGVGKSTISRVLRGESWGHVK